MSERTTLTHVTIQALKVVRFELSAKRWANRTKALAIFADCLKKLHVKEPPNQVSHKAIKLDPIRPFQAWKKSNQISKSYAL